MLVTFVTPTQPAGSIGGLTLYKHGDSFAGRSRAMPCKVWSTRRQQATNLISVLSVAWETPLTNAQRAAWGNYAYNTPLLDAYSAPKYIKGYAHYLRSNRPRLQFGVDRIDAAPTTFGLPPYTLPTFSTDFTLRTVTIATSNTDAWANQDNAYMFLWISRPTQQARNRPPETYQPLGAIAGSSTTPPASTAFALPDWIPSHLVYYWIRSSVSDSQGRLSGV